MRPRPTTEVATPWNSRLIVHTGDMSHYGDFLTSGVSWQYETDYLLSSISAGSTIIDVGANYGYTASLMSHAAGAAGLVLAIEPEPEMCAMLRTNMSRNSHDNVIVVEAALGSSARPVQLWRSATHLACHSLNRSLVPEVNSVVEVAGLTLDDVRDRYLEIERGCDLIKVDVEGWELEVLRGSETTIAKYRPDLWIEFWPDGLRANGCDPMEILNYLTSQAYAYSAHDLAIGEEVECDDAKVIEYCDRVSRRFQAAGRTDLYGIVYLHATCSEKMPAR